MKMLSFAEMMWQDIVYALRWMSKQPAFAITAFLTLALAIGGNTAIFTVTHAVLLKPLPYPNSERLVSISGGATPSRFVEMRAAAHSFAGIGAFSGEENVTLSGLGEPEVLRGARVSANFLDILRVNPLLGRTFRAAEDGPGGPPVVMISERLWQSKFGGSSDILGKAANLSETSYTIIGVLPPHFSFPFADVDVWMTAPSEWPLMPAKTRALSPFLTVFGRLNPSASLIQANAEARVIQRQYATAHPTMLDAKAKKPEQVTRMRDTLVADVRSMLWMLMGAVGFVLLIACANVASLLLAKASSRARETAVRAALGAGRSRLIVQLVTESLVISLAGGIAGVLLAVWALRAIPGITAFQLPRAQEIGFDWTVIAFAFALTIATGILFGLAPALNASRPDLIAALRMTGVATGQRPSRRVPGGLNSRGLLLVLEVSLSVVLLIGTALLLQSVSRLRGVRLGFDSSNILTASISLPTSRYDTNPKKLAFFEQVVERIRSAPGIRTASASMFLPMTGYAGTPVQDASKPLLQLNERPIATVSVVTPGYFQTLEIPMVRGRDFADTDKQDSQRVAIVDEALARRFWPEYPRGQDPIGQHLWVGGSSPHPAQIIGIVGDVHHDLENSAWPMTVYVSFTQSPQSFGLIAVRTASSPAAFAGAIRKQVQALDRDQSVSSVKTMDDLIDEQLGERRLLIDLLGSFAAMALLLVLMGTYGIIAYSVAERTQELGIRRAMGAQRSDILRLIVGQSFGLTLLGVTMGLMAALGLTRLLGTLLFRISATDPATFVAVAALFVCVALAASYFPARRATRIDPAIALRI